MDLFLGHGRSARALAIAVLISVASAAPALAVALPGISYRGAPVKLTRGHAVGVRLHVVGGRHGSRRAVLTVALSADARLDRRDQVLVTQTLKALRAHRSRSVTVRVTAPGTTPLGARRLLACIAPSRRARARCLSRPVRILAPASPSPAPQPSPPSPPAPKPTPIATPVPAPAPQAPPEGDGHFPSTVPTTLPGVVPDPESVQAHPDSARSATALISSDTGGTLTATGADGTTYQLEVPPKAVLSDVNVTMTPLGSIGGLPFANGPSGGVQFGPEGLQLLQPATLTITPATAPTGTPVAFAYHGTGSDLALVPVQPGSGGAYTVAIMHFSGAGLAGASNGEIAAALQHAPSLTPDQFRAQIASDLQHGADGATILADAGAYFDAVIHPELAAALQDDSLIPAAVADALSLERELQLLGIDFGARGTEIDDDLVQFMVNEYNHAYARCVTNHDPVETRNMLGAARALQLIGADSRVDMTKLFGCLSFKLDLDLQGRGTVDTADPLLDGSLHVHATQVPLEFDTVLGRDIGSFPVTVDSYSWYDYLCNRTGGTATPGDPGTLQLFVSPNIVETVDATGRLASFGPPTLQLRVTPGKLTTTNACGLTGFSGSFYAQLWNTAFSDRHAPSDPTVVFGAGDWSFAGGDPWATADVTDTQSPAPDDVWTATVHLVLHHTPHAG
jgi:hypothetical protein